MSFRDIGAITKKVKLKVERERSDLDEDDDIKSKSKTTQAIVTLTNFWLLCC
jgi:hypothetical protein